jgi:hypothetical protein
VKTPVDLPLVHEAARFELRFACEDCAHFAAERAPTCGNGWPLLVRRAEIEAAGAELSFCKEFELA